MATDPIDRYLKEVIINRSVILRFLLGDGKVTWQTKQP